MNTKKLVTMALLVGMGAVLHSIIPGVFFGMKPDMLLTMMFLGILLFPDTKSVLLLGVSTGIISALTTNFPLGQIPNIIDKPITAFLFFGMVLLTKKLTKTYPKALVLTAIGTLVSGSIFLSSAAFLVGLPGGASFLVLFATVVLPTAAINTVMMGIVYPIVSKVQKNAKVA